MPTSTNRHPARIGFPAARLLALAAGFLLSGGCSDDGYGQRYPVSGKVTYKGELLKQGTINFIPTNATEGRPASATIDQGAYALTTFTQGDGVIPGSYKVTIVAAETDASKAEAASKATGAAFDEAHVAKAVKKSKSLIPKKYASAETSGLVKEVKAETNSFDFEMVD